MIITVLSFASIREITGHSEQQLEFSGSTVGEALDALQDKYPGLREWLEKGRVHLAVNDEYAEPEKRLNENDTLALIPPVSGGA